MPENESILSPDQENKLSRYFDDLVARAESPAPKFSDFKNPDDFSKAETAYQSNPMQEMIGKFQAERENGIKGGTPVKDAQALYEHRVHDLKKRFTSGIQHGAPDPDMERKQQGIFDALMHGDFMGAIKAFLLSLPFVGDFLAGAGKYARQNIAGNKIGFGQAKEQIKLEKALKGAALNMGLEEGALVRGGIAAYEDQDFKPMARPEYRAITQDVATQAQNENEALKKAKTSGAEDADRGAAANPAPGAGTPSAAASPSIH